MTASGTTEPPTYSSSATIGRLLGHVVGDADVEGRQHRRQHDHQPAQAEEDDRRVGHLVPDALDAVEESLHERALLLGGDGRVAGSTSVIGPAP